MINAWKALANGKASSRVVVFKGALWVQRLRDHDWYDLPYTTVYSHRTVDALKSLKIENVKKRLFPNFPSGAIADLMERRDQIVRASAMGTWIP